MAKKKRKRKPLKTNPKRQAHASLKGYLYQIWHSVNAWLDLADDEVLYLEGAEDFDVLSDDSATTVQVKHTGHNITLRSQEVNDAINHYWKLRANNPDHRVKFRFLTRSKIGMEQGNPFGEDKQGLTLWQRCAGNEAAITKISEFLQTESKISEAVKDFLKQVDPQEIYQRLIEPITWETDSKPASFVEQSINDKLVLHGNRQPIPIPPSDAKKVVDHLLKEALIVATQEKNRILTKVRFLEIFEEQTTQRISTQHLQHLQGQVKMMPSVGMPLFVGSSDITIQSYSHIQTEIPHTYLDVLVPRTDRLIKIQTELQSEGISVIHGGTGKGKTTLAKLTANTIRDKWFWLNFANRDPSSKDSSSQITQQLKQLAIAISSESAQVNVVLDDLNLQPQQLQAYKEDLGVVIYRVLKRGAKILITSQHKPPNNFIQSLGLSSSVVIDVPDFTMSEIEHFAEQLGCPSNLVEDWTKLIQAHTDGHPRLVHAWLVQLREKGWDEQNIVTSFFQPPEEVVEEREAARLLLTDLPEDHRKFLYRLSLMSIGFRRDYALNIAEIPDSIPYPGDVFSQLVGPWIDQVSEAYYSISSLLKDAAKQVWSASEIKNLHACIANAILEADHLTTIEARTVFHHSILGENKKGLISVIYSLITAPEDDWQNICQEFSWIRYLKTNPPDEFFPGDFFENHMFRSLQHRFSVEVEPELAPKILEIWDNETKKYKTHQSYLMVRLRLTTQALRYNQAQFSAKKLMSYVKEIYDIKNMDKKVWKSYFNSMEELKEINIDESNFFSFLFSFIYMRPEINAVFLNELIDTLDKLDPRVRMLLLADFEDDGVESRLLIDGVWWTEANLENPDWTRCFEVFDQVIEKSIAWDYPHIAAAAARGKAIIYDEYLDDRDTAHKVLQEVISKVGPLPVIEEEQAFIYFHEEYYKEALNIYERILPKWNPPSRQLDFMPPEACRRAAMCAAHLDHWQKAATFFEEGAKRTQKIENTERYIGLYADAGFAHFKVGNMFNCIKLLHLALQNFETLPQDNTDITYFTLKKRLEHTIKWIKTIWYESEDNSPEPFEPAVGFCSDPETKEEFLNLPDCPTGYAWLHLSQIEYRFGHQTTVFQHALQTPDRKEYPVLNFFLSFLEAQYEFRNKTFDNLPRRIYQLALAYSTSKKHQQSGRGVEEKGSYSISDSDLSDFASVDNIIAIFSAALLVEIRKNKNGQDTLAKWRTNSSELPIKENIFIALDLIEAVLSGDRSYALTVMKTLDAKIEKRLIAALKVIHNVETSMENLFFAHTCIATSFIDSPWEGLVVKDLEVLLSLQWLEKIRSGAMWQININTVQQIEQACNSSEAGKKKIGQILLAAYPVVTTMVDPHTLQKFRSWAESEHIQKTATRKNPAAQRLIKAMERPPHLTDEDIEALNQSIKEGEIPIKFDSPFDSDEGDP